MEVEVEVEGTLNFEQIPAPGSGSGDDAKLTFTCALASVRTWCSGALQLQSRRSAPTVAQAM
jgi:hypothetical protein